LVLHSKHLQDFRKLERLDREVGDQERGGDFNLPVPVFGYRYGPADFADILFLVA
jgi:hypothetical protein